MNTYAKAGPADKATSSRQATSRKQNDLEPAQHPTDSRPAAGQLKQLQELADTGDQTKPLRQTLTLSGAFPTYQLQTIQLGRNGSHGKTRMLNVAGTYTEAGGVAQSFKDRDQDISIVKGHGGYEDEDALAEAWVRSAYSLKSADTVTITSYNFFTKR